VGQRQIPYSRPARQVIQIKDLNDKENCNEDNHAFRILLVVVMVILPMVAVTPANAGVGRHYQEIIPVDDSGETNIPCEFVTIYHQWGYFRINYLFDQNGQLIKEIDIWGTLKQTITAPDTGKTVDVQIQGPGHYEFTYPEENVIVMKVSGTGTSSLITAPGMGRIGPGGGVNMVETYTFDTTDPNNWILKSYSLDKLVGNTNPHDWTTFCEYMGS